jgi:hypothetical protein
VANQLANGEKLAVKKKANSKRGVLNKNMWDLERTEAERSGSELWDAPAAAPTEVDLNPWLHPLRGHAGRNMDENGAAVPIKAPHSFGDSMPTSIAAVVPVASGASYNPSDAAHQVGGCGDLPSTHPRQRNSTLPFPVPSLPRLATTRHYERFSCV